jgi:hypothetical protein
MPTNDGDRGELENNFLGCRMSKAAIDVITNKTIK